MNKNTMTKKELINEIKFVLKETNRTGFDIGNYIKYFNKMRNLLSIAMDYLSSEMMKNE
jgi:hypothetical protein